MGDTLQRQGNRIIYAVHCLGLFMNGFQFLRWQFFTVITRPDDDGRSGRRSEGRITAVVRFSADGLSRATSAFDTVVAGRILIARAAHGVLAATVDALTIIGKTVQVPVS